jgi:hypothetical protein
MLLLLLLLLMMILKPLMLVLLTLLLYSHGRPMPRTWISSKSAFYPPHSLLIQQDCRTPVLHTSIDIGVAAFIAVPGVVPAAIRVPATFIVAFINPITASGVNIPMIRVLQV